MKFKDFYQSIYNQAYKSDDIRQTLCYDSIIVETSNGLFIDGERSELSSLEEARVYITEKRVQENIQKQVECELYEEMSYHTLAHIIKKYHNVRITDTLIESYVELASSRLFTTDPVAQDIQRRAKTNRLFEGRFEYVLSDGSRVVVNEDTQQYINKVLSNHQDIIEYMRESKDNFLDVLNQLGE